MRTSNEKQDEIFTLIVEMLEVLKSVGSAILTMINTLNS